MDDPEAIRLGETDDQADLDDGIEPAEDGAGATHGRGPYPQDRSSAPGSLALAAGRTTVRAKPGRPPSGIAESTP